MTRPRVTVNIALSLNGMIAGPGGRRVVISSAADRMRVHRLRSENDAVLVGANTVINDNPHLTVDRTLVPDGHDPVRIVLDRNLRIRRNSNVLDGAARTIILTSAQTGRIEGADIMILPQERLTPGVILNELGDLGLGKILIEGGREVIRDFVLSGNVDEFTVFVAPVLIERGGLQLFDPQADIFPSVVAMMNIDGGLVISLDPHSLMIAWMS